LNAQRRRLFIQMTAERYKQIKAGVTRHRREEALIAEMASVKPTPEIEATDWKFDITPEQLGDFLESLNAELASEDGSLQVV
jgi:hypothetical protein